MVVLDLQGDAYLFSFMAFLDGHHATRFGAKLASSLLYDGTAAVKESHARSADVSPVYTTGHRECLQGIAIRAGLRVR